MGCRIKLHPLILLFFIPGTVSRWAEKDRVIEEQLQKEREEVERIKKEQEANGKWNFYSYIYNNLKGKSGVGMIYDKVKACVFIGVLYFLSFSLFSETIIHSSVARGGKRGRPPPNHRQR